MRTLRGGNTAKILQTRPRPSFSPLLNKCQRNGNTRNERLRGRRLCTVATPVLNEQPSVYPSGRSGRAIELGIKAYLTKPIKRSELLQAVRLVLGSAGVAEENRPVVTIHSLRESRGRLRILLVEDNRVNQAVATQFLEKRGHEVVVAGNGRVALEASEKQTPDLVLMDVQMPEMDGLQATAAIRQGELKSGKHIPIIAMTAHAMAGDKERCLGAGMDGYVSKPLRVEDLFSTIEEVLRILAESKIVVSLSV